MNKGSSSALQNIPGDHLVAAGLSCVRGEKMLFRDLNFAVEPGQAGLLTGPNGVGKSSLLRLIAGLLDPFSGAVHAPSAVALCDDRLALDENIPLQSALEFWATMDGKAQNECEAAMTAAGLDHLAEVPVRYFSTGQRQRARLARTYLTGAQLWLLDEPANGLDAASVAQLGIALQAHLDQGGSILAASHIPLPIDFTLSLTLEPMP
jgi:heme exporter protein A